MTVRRLIGMSMILLALAGTLAAQSRKEKKEQAQIRALIGTVTDADDKPVDGAVVQLKDLKTLQVRSFITKDGGTYRFSGLNVNVDYEVKAEFQGMTSQTRQLSIFDERRNPILNLKLQKK